MSRLLVCLALTAPALAAQRPWLHPGAAMSLVRYARTDGSDTTSVTDRIYGSGFGLLAFVLLYALLSGE